MSNSSPASRTESNTVRLKYFGYHPYNNPTHSERNVELPIGFWFLERFRNDLSNLIEVGEVMPFYERPTHAVYDLVSDWPSTIKRDAADVEYKGKNLLCISTIEHIGTSDYGQTPDPSKLPPILEKMLTSKNYLITFALGYNTQLESLVRDRNYYVLKRISSTRWKQTDDKTLTGYQYHKPWYGGNGLCLLTNLEGLRFEFTPRSIFHPLVRVGARGWSWRFFYQSCKTGWKERSIA